MEENGARGDGGAGCRGLIRLALGYQVCFDIGDCHSTAVLDAESRGAARELRRDAGATGMFFRVLSFSPSPSLFIYLPLFERITRPPNGKKGQKGSYIIAQVSHVTQVATE